MLFGGQGPGSTPCLFRRAPVYLGPRGRQGFPSPASTPAPSSAPAGGLAAKASALALGPASAHVSWSLMDQSVTVRMATVALGVPAVLHRAEFVLEELQHCGVEVLVPALHVVRAPRPSRRPA